MSGCGREAPQAPPQPRPTNQLQARLQGEGGARQVWFFSDYLERESTGVNRLIFALDTMTKRQMCVCAPADRGLAEALVEAHQSAENLLAVGVQFLQLILYQRRILR